MELKKILLILFSLILLASVISAFPLNSSSYGIAPLSIGSFGKNSSSPSYSLYTASETIISNPSSANFKIFLGFLPTAIVNTPPRFTILFPLNKTHAHANISTTFEVIDDDLDLITCLLYVNNSINSSVENITSGTTITLRSYITEDGTYSWYVICTDGVDYTQSDERIYTIDTIFPDIIWINPLEDNLTIITSPSIFEQYVGFYDTYLLQTLCNITNASGHSMWQDYQEDLNVTSYNCTTILDISTWNDGTYTYFAQATDDSTFGGKNPKVRKEKNKINFLDEYTNLKITAFALGRKLPSDFNTWFKEDKRDDIGEHIKFGFTFKVDDDELETIRLHLQSDDTLKYREPITKVKGHFVWGNKYYIKFHDLVEQGFDVKITILNSKEAYIDVSKKWKKDDFIDIDPVVGGLNTKTEIVSFVIEKDVYPPNISDWSVNKTHIFLGQSIRLNATITDTSNISEVIFYLQIPEVSCNLTPINISSHYFYILDAMTFPCNTNMQGLYNFTGIRARDVHNNSQEVSFLLQFYVYNATGLISLLPYDDTFTNHKFCFYEKVKIFNSTEYRMVFYRCIDARNKTALRLSAETEYTIIVVEEKLFNILSIDSIITLEKTITKLHNMIPFFIGISIILIILSVLLRETKSVAKWGKRYY